MNIQTENAAKGIKSLLGAQFFSAIADNALLIVAFALLEEGAHDPWWMPVLKGLSIFSFVAFAPWVGVWSDRWPKRQVMMTANAIKACACFGLLWGVHPFFSFALLGIGAALYSPAKYGLITELEPQDRLVKANAWIEVSTVVAAVVGVVLGGWCVSERVQGSDFSEFLSTWLDFETQLLPAFMVLLCLYMAAGLLNLKIPESGVTYERRSDALKGVARFIQSNKTLWLDPKGRLSLSVTTLFWGVGASMQLMTLAWAQAHLGVSLELSSYIQAMSALGAMAGAWLAARFLQMHHAKHLLWVGLLLGALLPVLNWVHSLSMAMLLMGLAGLLSGLFVVPMNALLQSRGRELLSAGESIAVQNFNENFCVLSMMGLYSVLLALQIPVQSLLNILGACIAVCMVWIMCEQAKISSQKSVTSNQEKA